MDKLEEFDYDLALESIDYSFPNYSPSADSLEFFALMRIVNGGDFEVDTPMAHYFMIDVVFGNVTDPKQFPYSPEVQKNLDINLDRIGIIASRGLAKSTVITAFLPVYCAIKGYIPNRGKVYFNLILAASTQSGARVIAKSIKALCYESRFCNEYFEEMRFTETECEFVRKGNEKREKRTFLVRLQGVGTAIRGVRDHAGRRPCHVRGTEVTTEYGSYMVEDHPANKQECNWEIATKVKVWGLTSEEVVSDDHKYWARLHTKSKVSKKTKELYPFAKPNTMYAPEWVEASNLTNDHYIGEYIDTFEGGIQPILFNTTVIKDRDSKGHILYADQKPELKYHPYMERNEWWWLYGLWLGDGCSNKQGLVKWSIAESQRNTVGSKVIALCKSLGKIPFETSNVGGSYYLSISDTALSNWLQEHKNGNSIKNPPKWVWDLPIDKQKEILLGYIAADGYISEKENQVRINSVNYNAIKFLQNIASRLGLPSYIRNTKKEGKQYFNSTGKVHDISHQYEILLRHNVSKILGIEGIDNQKKLVIPHVFISEGSIWRQVKSISKTEGEVELIPIQCNNSLLNEQCGTVHSYKTEFGTSKNCFISFDDVIADTAAAYSETQMHNLEDAMLSDATNALKANGGFTISIATPFHRGDPVCKPIINRSVTPVLLPICSHIDDDTTEETYNGAWPEMHPFKSVKSQYINAKKNNKLSSFNLERMLQMSNEEDRLVTDDMIQWYDRNLIVKMIEGYSLYMTTDFTTTSAAKSDFSAICLWAVSSNNDYFLLDLCLRRQELQQQYDEVFRMISYWGKYKHIEVGVEIDGQQKAHLFSLKQMMQKKGLYFSFARQKGAPVSREGILSKVGASSKHERFRYIVPMFQNKKFYFPEQLRETPEMKEALKQIRGATMTGFSAKDDFCDGTSQLGMIDIIPGSGTFSNEDYDKVDTSMWADIYEEESFSNRSTIF